MFAAGRLENPTPQRCRAGGGGDDRGSPSGRPGELTPRMNLKCQVCFVLFCFISELKAGSVSACVSEAKACQNLLKAPRGWQPGMALVVSVRVRQLHLELL